MKLNIESNFSIIYVCVQQPSVKCYNAGRCPQNTFAFDLGSREDF